MRILCVQGSLGRPSHTATMVTTVAARLERLGAYLDLIDLRLTDYPDPDPVHHADPTVHPSAVVRDLAERANAADAFVLASPVYHNSYSGVLKNCLDHLGIRQFEGKPVALCGNGGFRASVQPCDHLRIVVRGLHGVAIPYNIVSCNDDYVLAADGYQIRSEQLLDRLDRMVQQLYQFTTQLNNDGESTVF